MPPPAPATPSRHPPYSYSQPREKRPMNLIPWPAPQRDDRPQARIHASVLYVCSQLHLSSYMAAVGIFYGDHNPAPPAILAPELTFRLALPGNSNPSCRRIQDGGGVRNTVVHAIPKHPRMRAKQHQHCGGLRGDPRSLWDQKAGGQGESVSCLSACSSPQRPNTRSL